MNVTRTRTTLYIDTDIQLNLANYLTAKLFNFHSLEVVSRWRDPQLEVSDNCSDEQILIASVVFRHLIDTINTFFLRANNTLNQQI